jgi:hypothetical protein
MSNLATMAAAAALASPALADEVDGIYCPQREVIVVRGGLFMVRLEAERPGDNWPSEITVRFQRGGSVQGAVIWQYVDAQPARVHWTTPPVAMWAREIDPEDDSSSGLGTPFLVAHVPPDAEGRITLLGRDLEPIWASAPADALLGPLEGDAAALERFGAPDRPDPNSPYEYWRWVLLAARQGMRPPPPGGSDVEQMVAQYQADLWRVGIARLFHADQRVATQCLNLLTATASDEGLRFAAWITDSGDLYYLLSTLLDFDLDGSRLARRAQDWADTREQLFFWSEGSDASGVRLAFVNGGFDERVISLRWRFTDRARDAREIPVAVQVPAGALVRASFPHPVADEPARRGAPPPPPTLLIESRDFSREVQVRPHQIAARPPGLNFGALQPVLTLVEARDAALTPPDEARAAFATLRRINGRWEVFFECFRPLITAPLNEPTDSAFLEELSHYRDTRGIEAVTILIGPEDRPNAALTIPQHGWHRLWVGEPSDSLQIHRKTWADRWHCRVVLPDEWLEYPWAETVQIGFLRTHAESTAMDTGPNPTPPWLLEPGRIEVFMHAWEDLPPSR